MTIGNGVNGNGEVTSVTRSISQDFNEIKVSEGLDLYLTQSNAIALSIEADQNLHDLIITEVENNILRIYTSEKIGNSKAKKIYLNFKDITVINATSGSDVYATNTIKVDELQLNATSGADITLTVNTQKLECNATSGSDISLNGTTDAFFAQATSGSDIKASDLMAKTSHVKATSGADISVNSSKELTAMATSGGDVKYSGNPDKIIISDSSLGDVSQN
jgi:hypothetical protein